MPYINSSIVHVGPVPKGPGAAHRAKKAVTGSRAVKGAKRRAKHAYYNATSTKTTNMTGETIGKKPPKHPDNKPDFEMNTQGAQWGAVAGLIGGGVAGAAAGKKKYPESKEWKQGVHNVRKAYIRITDVGTAAGKAGGHKATRWPRFPGKALGAGAVGGAGGGYGLQKLEYRERQKQVQRYKKKTVAKNMSISAFGVDHGVVSKASGPADPKTGKQASTGRRVLASSPFGVSLAHPLVAGKKGKKGRAFGNQVGGSILGGVGGAAVGAALTRGRSASAIRGGTLGGTIGGQQMGLNRNQRKGYLKPES